MSWYYEYNREQRGPVPDEELDRLITQGQVLPTTLVWREGMPAWAPLAVARPAAAAVPTGAPGAVACASCGRSFAPSDVIELGGHPICADCKPLVLQRIQQGDSLETLADADRTGPAWEQRETLGFFPAVIETVQAVLLRPSQTFRTMRVTGGLTNPFWYYFIVGGFGNAIYMIYYLTASFFFNPAFKVLREQNSMSFGPGMVAVSILVVFLASLIGATINAFLYSGILHLCLMICGGARRPYEATFRALCYGNGSAMLLHIVPVVGTIVAIPWMIVTSCFGLARAHGTETWRAVLAVLLPIFACCGLFVVLGIVVGAAISKSAGMH